MRPMQGENVSVRGHSKRKDEEGSEHVQYNIEVEWGAGSPWMVYKRYSEFEMLHKTLQSVYGKEQVPTFPKKKRLPVGHSSERFLEKRMLKLEQYLREVADQWSMWFQMEGKVTGPGTMLGISEHLFDFLEFSQHAIICAPASGGVEGEGFFVAERDAAAAAQQPKVVPLLTGLELSSLLTSMRDVDITEDDERVPVVTDHLERLRGEGKACSLNVLQAKTLLGEAFFQSTRLQLLQKILPAIQDPHKYPALLVAFDIDEDVEAAARLFEEYNRRRERRLLSGSPLADLSPTFPARRERGTTLAPC